MALINFRLLVWLWPQGPLRLKPGNCWEPSNQINGCVWSRVCKAWICKAVCATVERHTKILCQNNNFCLKGVVCSTHRWRLISTTLDCVILCLSCVVMMVFQSKAAVCVSGKTADTGGESVRAVIYRNLLCLALCCGLPLGLSLLSHIMFPCYFLSQITMMPDLQSGKCSCVPLWEQMYYFPAKSYCLGFFLVRCRPKQSCL